MIERIGFKYSFDHDPLKTSPDALIDQITNNEKGGKISVNCQLYAACVVRALGFYIPDYYRSSEFFLDPEGYLNSVGYPENTLRSGDILGFSKDFNTDVKRIHLGVVRIANGATEILHIYPDKEGVAVMTIQEITNNKSHRQVRFAKRPIQFHPSLYNLTALTKLNFFNQSV